MSGGQHSVIGRDVELGIVAEVLEAARAGRGRLLVIAGEAGIGKSRLSRWAIERAMALGFEPALACAIGGAEDTFVPALHSVAPWLSSVGLKAPSAKEAMWETMQALLMRAAARASTRPILWLLEDLQRADVASLELLQFLAHPLEAMPALVVATLRTNDPQAGSGCFASRQASFERLGFWLRLEPLSADASLTVATQRLGRHLTLDERDRVHRNGAGNPLFIEQTVWQFGRGSQSPSGAIQELVAARLAALPARCTSLLEIAAILGPEFQVATLAELARVLPAAAIDALETAQRADVLIELEPGRFRFRHALYTEVIVAAQTTARRRELHEKAAAAYCKRGNALPLRLERTRHLLRAAQLGATIDMRFVRHTIAELDRARSLDHAHSLNLMVWNAQKVGALPAPTVDELLYVAQVARRAGAYEDARRACLAAVDTALVDDDPYLLSRAALALGAETTAAKIDPELVRVLRTALSRAANLEAAVRLRLQARLAAAMQPAPDPELPCQMARSTLMLATALDDDDAMSDILYFCGAALTDFAPAEELSEIARRLLTLCRRLDDHPRALRACTRLATARVSVGDFVGLDTALNDAAYHAEQGPPAQRWRYLLLSSMRAFARGGILDSERLTVEAERLADLTDEAALLTSVLAHRAQHQATLGSIANLDGTLASIRSSVALLGISGLVANAINAVLLARVRERTRCSLELHAIPDMAVRTLMVSFTCLAEAIAFAGTDTQARIAREALADCSCVHLTSGQVPLTYEGPSARLRALVAARLGDMDQALREIADAQQQCVSAALTTWEARVRVERATLLLQAKRPQEASVAIEEALSLCAELGCTQMAECLPRPQASTPLIRGDIEGASLVRDGELWVLSYASRTVRLAHSRGVEILARLIDRPNEEIHVLTLSSDTEGELVDSDAGQVLDGQAVREYRRRLARLSARLAKQPQGVAKQSMVAEIEWLGRELARADSKGSMPRRAGSLAERARVNVQRRIKDTLQRIELLDPLLAQHLKSALRTGTYCIFRP